VELLLLLGLVELVELVERDAEDKDDADDDFWDGGFSNLSSMMMMCVSKCVCVCVEVCVCDQEYRSAGVQCVLLVWVCVTKVKVISLIDKNFVCLPIISTRSKKDHALFEARRMA